MNSRQAQFAIHLTALLFGLTGILGELIRSSPVLITAGRAVFATAALLPLVWHSGHLSTRQRADFGARTSHAVPVIVIAGLMLAAHWITFFISIKVAGVAIATLGFASFPAFITLLEGLLFHERTARSEWIVVAIVTIGLILVTPSFDFRDQATQGLFWGISSGLTFALFTLANRKAVTLVSARALACWENLIVAGVTLPWCLVEFLHLRALDWLWLFTLGVFCTALSHALLVASLERLKARTAGIVVALEPVYAIVFAAFLFAQYPSPRAIVGGLFIIGAIVWSGVQGRNHEHRAHPIGPPKRAAPAGTSTQTARGDASPPRQKG